MSFTIPKIDRSIAISSTFTILLGASVNMAKGKKKKLQSTVHWGELPCESIVSPDDVFKSSNGDLVEDSEEEEK